jgi:transposase-like protein
MTITKENFKSLLPGLKLAATKLKGSARRMYLGQLALDLGSGGKSLVSKELGISRQTLRKGIREAQSGQAQEDKFSKRGRKPLEEKYPELLEAIKEIVDGASQTDPKFTSTRLYTRLSANEVRKQLIKRGYKEEELPTNQTILNKMQGLGYKRKKVAKTKPKKK